MAAPSTVTETAISTTSATGNEDASPRRGTIFEQAQNRKKVSLEWSDVHFGTGKKEILRGVSGRADPGQVVAIMGPSGAGKTTLLDALAGRLIADKTNKVSGRVLVNGKRRDYHNFAQTAAYVLQADYFMAEMTVRETIALSAMLRLPDSISTQEKQERVDQVIRELGLVKCQDTYVGNELIRGVSGGERKRVNIGVELVTNPSLIFLDEPTSGLDSNSAESVMKTLLELASNSRTILTTIHQPRSSIFALFDSLLLLADGRSMYFGPARECAPYFGRLGFDCPSEYNPADFFLDILTPDEVDGDQEAAKKNRIALFEEEYKKHNQNLLAIADGSDAAGASNQDLTQVEEDDEAYHKYPTNWLLQFKELGIRSWKNLLRQRISIIVIIAQTLIFSLLLGFIWLREGGDESGIVVQSTVGLMIFCVVNISFVGAFGVVFRFPAERAVVLKERASKMYRLSAYFWSKTIVDLPRILSSALIYSIIVYWMSGMRDEAGAFFAFYIVLVMCQIASEGIGYAVSAGAANPAMAGALLPVFIIASFLFAGFFITPGNIPVWLRWLRFISFLRYGFAIAIQNQYRDRDLDTSACTDSFCPASGEAAINYYDVDELSFSVNYVLLLVLGIAIRIAAYLILLRRGPKFERRL